MTTNVGTIDRALRIIVGLALLYFAFFAAPTGYNWIGYIGFLPILTALIGNCPAYSLLGFNTCPMKRT